MELTDSTGGSSATIINTDADNPVIIDIHPGTAADSGEETLKDVLDDAIDDSALTDSTTYDGYILTPLYIEMDLEAAFHVPSYADESGYSMIYSAIGDEETHTFRFYFNAADNYWKRDILVYLSGIKDDTGAVDFAYPDGWYWMRRVLEPGSSSSSTDFFILAEADGETYSTTNPRPEHPTSGTGPTSIIDLFDNEDFWGDAEDYDSSDSADQIVIDSNDDVGGLNTAWSAFTWNTGDTVDSAAGDITYGFNFKYETNSDFIFTDLAPDLDVVDFGPDSDDPSISGDEESYGDWGFHPFMPDLSVVLN